MRLESACSMSIFAFRKASRWRTLVIIAESGEIDSPWMTESKIDVFKSSNPCPVSIEVSTMGLSGVSFWICSMSKSSVKSILFKTVMDFLSFVSSSSLRSSSVRGSDASSMTSNKSERSSHSLLRFTPAYSTVSDVSLMPAVSMSLIGMPRMLAYSSMVSRVVPGISVTIARSS